MLDEEDTQRARVGMASATAQNEAQGDVESEPRRGDPHLGLNVGVPLIH